MQPVFAMRDGLAYQHRMGDAMRMDLKVPFAEKDAAKKLGARWDAARKLWYVEDKVDLAPFAKWAPTPRSGAAGEVPAQRASGSARQVSAGKAVVGSAYVAYAPECACSPWVLCEKCRPGALPGAI